MILAEVRLWSRGSARELTSPEILCSSMFTNSMISYVRNILPLSFMLKNSVSLPCNVPGYMTAGTMHSIHILTCTASRRAYDDFYHSTPTITYEMNYHSVIFPYRSLPYPRSLATLYMFRSRGSSSLDHSGYICGLKDAHFNESPKSQVIIGVFYTLAWTAIMDSAAHIPIRLSHAGRVAVTSVVSTLCL